MAPTAHRRVTGRWLVLRLITMDADDIAFYQKHKYWISPVIVPADILDTAEHKMERFYADDHDHVLPDIPTTQN